MRRIVVLSIDVISAPSIALLLAMTPGLPSRLPELLEDRMALLSLDFDRRLGGERSFEVISDFFDEDSCCTERC